MYTDAELNRMCAEADIYPYTCDEDGGDVEQDICETEECVLVKFNPASSLDSAVAWVERMGMYWDVKRIKKGYYATIFDLKLEYGYISVIDNNHARALILAGLKALNKITE